MKGFGKFLAIAAMAMASYSASAELAPQWAKGTLIANAEVGISPVGAAVSADYVLVDSWWMGHFTVGGEIDLGTYTHETGLGFTPRATYGLNITEQFEVHAAVGFGLGHWSYKNGDYSSSANFTYHICKPSNHQCSFLMFKKF